MLMDRQTDRHTHRHVHHNTLLLRVKLQAHKETVRHVDSVDCDVHVCVCACVWTHTRALFGDISNTHFSLESIVCEDGVSFHYTSTYPSYMIQNKTDLELYINIINIIIIIIIIIILLKTLEQWTCLEDEISRNCSKITNVFANKQFC